MGREIHPVSPSPISRRNLSGVAYPFSVATSGQSPLETPLQEAPQQSLLPPPIRREDGKLMAGHHGIQKKRVRKGLMEEINADPEKWQQVLKLWFQDCLHPDPAVRADARKSLADRLDGKPTQRVEEEGKGAGDTRIQIVFTADPRGAR